MTRSVNVTSLKASIDTSGEVTIALDNGPVDTITVFGEHPTDVRKRDDPLHSAPVEIIGVFENVSEDLPRHVSPDINPARSENALVNAPLNEFEGL